MADLEKEIKKDEKKIQNFFKKKENIWMSFAIVLVVALILVVVWPSGMSANAAGENLVNYLNTQVVADGGVVLKSVEAEGSLYKVLVTYQGQEIPVYTTKSGDYFIQGATLIDSASVGTGNVVEDTPTDVPKTAKPKVEAFVFSYCPYGLQFEKALLPVYNLLKNNADINLVAIGAMHGIHEETESLRQIAIQQIYGKDKLWQYLEKFMANTKIGDCNNDMTCSKPLVEAIMKSLSIDVTKVNDYMTKNSKALYEADGERSAELGISGSPTFVINGVQVNVGRNPEAIKAAICSAFTTAPSECSQTLSTASASAWFGSDAASSASSAASCG